MGTEIRLRIGEVSLDYAKNDMGNDYGFVFQEGDVARRTSDAINYDYYRASPDAVADLEAHEEAFVRPLKRVLPRLDLLGYTLERAREEYQMLVDDGRYLDGLEEDESIDATSSLLTFEQFCILACRYPIATLASDYVEWDVGTERAAIAQGRLAADGNDIDRVPWAGSSNSYWSEASYLSDKLCILSAPSMLQVFGRSPANEDAEVIWQFGPLVRSGWAPRDAFEPGATRNQTILVATEGASDSRIIKRSLEILRPEVADFFRFIDVEERHHFWGTGNLVKFAEGLVRIDIQNQVLFLLDNDAEGAEAYRKLQQLRLLPNMRAMLMPDLEQFRSFRARGPEGTSVSDINGRAAAIECYLDLNLKDYPPAQVLWSNYKKDVDAWQGALEYKESYTQHFLDQTKGGVMADGYDISKLESLLDALIAEASVLSTSMLPEVVGLFD